jgi:hypothetical protein
MRKFFVFACICISFLVQAQKYPTQGNWNITISAGAGSLRYGERPSLSGFGSGFTNTAISGIAVLGAEKHFNKFTSLHLEVGTFVADGFQINVTNISIIPTIKIPSKKRFVFSTGVRFGLGSLREREDRDPILGLGHQFRFKWLMGDIRLYNTVFMGEFSIVLEPFYFLNTQTRFVGSNRQIRIQLALPLSK